MKFFYVAATAEVEPAPVHAVRECVERQFGVPVRHMELPSVDFAYDAGRRQYASIPVLEMVARHCPSDALKLLAITERDLFIPVLTFVFGHAQLGGRAAVISLARLRQEFYGLPANRDIFLERACKEALHEAGHTFGLVHCADAACAMSLSTGVRQIDSKLAAYCGACSARLGRERRTEI